ncbi:molybdenum cofactor biosynthesis protein MoaE [Devosia sp.]|uniref:molybdenum cofactor biosynthesis protein MoaE n=1 Tax=Devosia sp. TaxID=1871048 RepID=UPI003F717182
MFQPGAELDRFVNGRSDIGAVVTFTGIVRSDPTDPLVAMTLEHHQELAEAEVVGIVAEAVVRFQLRDALVIHRFGRMLPGEPIMQVITVAPHRQAAFDGASFLMDYLKTGAPFWKKEETASGSRWVEAKLDDDAARDRWAF